MDVIIIDDDECEGPVDMDLQKAIEQSLGRQSEGEAGECMAPTNDASSLKYVFNVIQDAQTQPFMNGRMNGRETRRPENGASSRVSASVLLASGGEWTL
jgi:hypothetical protein